MAGAGDAGNAPAPDELAAVVAAARVGWLTLDPLSAVLRAHGLATLIGVADGVVDIATLASKLDPTDAARLVEALGIAVHTDDTTALVVHTRGRLALAADIRRVTGAQPRAIAVVRDASVDERRGADLRLVLAGRDQLERMVQGGTWVFEMATMTLTWSPGVFRIHGLDPATHKPSAERGLDLVHPDDRRIVMQMSTRATIEGTSAPFDCRILRPDGSQRIISTALHLERDPGGTPLRMLGAVLDVTERRQLEKLLADAQRTDALGRMAGGIAHDFNNLLAAMTLGLAMSRRRRESQNGLQLGLDTVDAALTRAGALARQLLAFSRRQPLSPRVLRPDRVLDEMAGLLRRLVGGRIELAIVRVDDEAWPVKIDQTQLEQVVLNLVVNARDAIAAGADRAGHGTIRIELRNLPVDPGATAPTGPQVAIDVIDDGVGMTPELQAHIFDPFFTTKRPGEGTGIGLATCMAIVQQARGRIAIASAPGAGSRFTLILPRSLEPLPVESLVTPLAPSRQLNILVVDDDDAVRGSIVHELEWQGHAAMGAASADEALQLAAGFPGRLDLVLTDVLLGRDDGVALAHQLAARFPDARILLVTGFVPDTADALLPFPVLAKPFTGEALATRIAEVLAP